MIAGDLYEGWLGENNEVEVRKVSKSALVWNNPSCGHRSKIVSIVTLDELKTVCSNLKASSKALLNIVISEGKVELKTVKKNKKQPAKKKPGG